MPSLKHLFDACLYLYNHLESIAYSQRDPFQQTAANALYYHSVLVEEIETLDGAGVQILADEQSRDQILGSFSDLPEIVAKLDYRNICYNALYDNSPKWDYAISPLFITLPSLPSHRCFCVIGISIRIIIP